MPEHAVQSQIKVLINLKRGYGKNTEQRIRKHKVGLIESVEGLFNCRYILHYPMILLAGLIRFQGRQL